MTTIDFESLAQFGTAPTEGCSQFGVGYDEAFDRLRERFLIRRFERGGSTEKFVVGPFGSGKTHFVRQLSEIARNEGCATAEVKLTRDVDLTHFPMVYRQIAQELRAPGADSRGIGPLLRACLTRVMSSIDGDTSMRTQVASGWADGLLHRDLQSEQFARVASAAFQALIVEDDSRFELARRWLSGEVSNRDVTKPLAVDRVSQVEESVFTRGMLLSLFQLVRAAGFRGTVVVLDEAEQSMQVAQQRLNYIFSVMQSMLNATADLEMGSAMIVYAITPNVRERIDAFPALQQRLATPVAFLDGNDFAAIIDLTQRQDPEGELRMIAEKLLEAFVDQEGPPPSNKADLLETDVHSIAARIAAEDPSSQSRRTLVKEVCTRLLRDQGFTPRAEREAEV